MLREKVLFWDLWSNIKAKCNIDIYYLLFQNSFSSKDLLPAHENLDNTDFSAEDKNSMLALIGGLHSLFLNCTFVMKST